MLAERMTRVLIDFPVLGKRVETDRWMDGMVANANSKIKQVAYHKS